jgi:hypothetical protein
MNIKNYTSQAEASNSIAKIKSLLIDAHARDIIERYNNGVCIGLAFVIPLYNRHFTFELPVRHKEVSDYLRKHKNMSEKVANEQALRTAWALLRDWVQIQLTMIYLEQAEPLELFFPYLTDGQQTYYEKIKSNDFKQLSA